MHDLTIANPTMSSREIAELTGKEHKNVMRDTRKMLEALEKDRLSFEAIYKDAYGRDQQEYRLDRELTLTLVSGYDIPLRHRVVTRLAELEYASKGLGRIARPGRPQTLTRNQVAASILLLRSAAEDLKLAPSAVLGGYQRLEAHLGVAGLLPAYAVDAPSTSVAGSSELTKAAGDLLEEHDVGMSAIAFNRLLVRHGFLEEHERPSSKGGTKKFKVVTDLEYGKNVTNPSNPRETQPHWYASKFAELLDLVLSANPGVVA